MRFREGQPSNDGSGSDFGPSSGAEPGADPRSQAYEALSRRVAKARAEQRLFSPDGSYRLAELEFNHLLQVYHNLSVPELVEHALMRGEGGLSLDGALCVKTVPHTTRSPRDTFIVGLDSPEIETGLEQSQASELSDAAFRHLYQEAQAYVQGRSLYVVDGEWGAGLEVRVVTELASQALFARQLLRPLGTAAGAAGETTSPEWLGSLKPGEDVDSAPTPPIVLIILPGLKGEPSLEPELQGDVFTALHPTHYLALLGGSRHFGEMVAALMHLAKPLLLARSSLPLDQCRVIQQETDGAWALAMGGEATVFSDDLEAKLLASLDLPTCALSLHETALPWIWSDTQVATMAAADYGAANVLVAPHRAIAAPRRTGTSQSGFGAVLENVILNAQNGAPMFNDRRWSEKPQWLIPQTAQCFRAAIQTLLIYLPDNLGVFPPVARLTLAQAQYYYLCGYGNWTSEAGDGDGPTQTEAERWGSFKPCFSPELRREEAIARMYCLGDRLMSLPKLPQLFLVNPCHPALEHALEQQQYVWLTPECLAQPDEHQSLAGTLFQRFECYMEQFKAEIPDAVRTAGPRL